MRPAFRQGRPTSMVCECFRGVASLFRRGASSLETSLLLGAVTGSEDRRRLEQVQQMVQTSRLGRLTDRSLLYLRGAWWSAAAIRVLTSQKNRVLAIGPVRSCRLAGWMLFVVVLTHLYLTADPVSEARTSPAIWVGLLAFSAVLMLAGDALARAWMSQSTKRQIDS